jgi:hypothetical protein
MLKHCLKKECRRKFGKHGSNTLTDAKAFVSFPSKEAKRIIYKHIIALLQMQVCQILPQGGKLNVDSG